MEQKYVIIKHIVQEPSKGIRMIHAIWLLGIFCIPTTPAWAQDQGMVQAQEQGMVQTQDQGQEVAQEQGMEQTQDQGHEVAQEVALTRKHLLVDYVEVNVEIPGGTDSLCILKFLEEWFIDPLKPSISKKVVEHDSACLDLLGNLAIKNGSIPVRKISYEFHLLDPHLVSSGNRAFPEPDSMDEPTRQFQEELSALITARNNFNNRYQLEDQLLSVIFHEEWRMNPVTMDVTKRVLALTPVIWQRRQTEAGDPVNEAETGLPVYYKNELKRLSLRNP